MNRPAKKLLFVAIAAAFMASVALSSNAAGLGRLTVNSALGQPLQAEIELVSLQPGEVDALTARVASPEAYSEAKVEYTQLLRQLRFEIDKRADTRAVLKITSFAPISEPFLDVLVEMTWPAGKVTREYPILLDPVGFNEAKINAPQVASVTPRTTAPAATPAKAADASPVAIPVSGSPSAKRESSVPAGDTYGPVKRGDTLRKIADEMRPDSVTLEQMLVALYRENKSAFVDNNMNRLKTGQILKVPSADEVAKISKGEAQKEIKVQVAAWKEFREKVAGIVATTPAKETASAPATGKIATAKADIPAPAAVSKDVLKLSKPEAATDKAGAAKNTAQERVNALKEEAIARENATREAASRAKELEKQIADTKKLLELKAAAAKQETKAVAKVEPPKAETKIAEAAPPVTPDAAKSDVKPADAPKVAEAKPAPPKMVPPPVKEPELMDQVVENAVPIGGGIVGLLGIGGLLMFMRKRKQNKSANPGSMMGNRTSSLIPSDLRATNTPTTGQGKGGLVDTGNSSFLTDFDKTGPGSIDTDEVDPVAEAEVYIAYGRDAQAEEILKEARGRDKNRHEVSLKLLEIYHTRKSTQAFETVARELKDMVGGTDPMWVKAAAMGAQIDPGNSLYGGSSPAYEATAAFAAGGAMAATESAAQTPPDVDFDLGFGGDAPSADAPLDVTSAAPSVDFDLNSPPASDSASAPATDVSLSTDSAVPALDFDLGFDAPLAGDAPADATHASKPTAAASASFDFDLSSLSLDDPETDATAGTNQEQFTQTVATKPSAPAVSDISLDLDSAPASANDGATATKLELAKAYIEIGDSDGAKEILNEVAREGSPAQQEEAKKILAGL